jgi:hypothetical protein
VTLDMKIFFNTFMTEGHDTVQLKLVKVIPLKLTDVFIPSMGS